MDIKFIQDIDVLQRVARNNGFMIFQNNSKPLNLNIWCIRHKGRIAGYFDDLMIIFWKDKGGVWNYKNFEVTVDPSEVSLFNMRNSLGVAIIRKGQYRHAWHFGKHKGDYEALVQRGNITVIRDFNKDNILDIPAEEDLKLWMTRGGEINISRTNGRYIEEFIKNNKTIYRVETGSNFGINCHRASAWRILEKVGLYSEGCVVHKDPSKYNNEFIPLVKESIKHWGDKFSFVLCHEEDFYR